MSRTSLARCATLPLVALAALGIVSRTLAPSLAHAQACVGDCDTSGDVTIDDLLIMVNVALGTQTFEACRAGDADGGQDITIEEILAAVNNALNRCPAAPTATPTTVIQVPTDTPVQPSATPTPTGTPEPTGTATQPVKADAAPPLAARVAIAAKGLSVAPIVVSAVANGVRLGTSTAPDFEPVGGSGAGACPLGGTATRTGNFPVPPVTFQLSQCKVATRDGAVTFNGTGSVTGSILSIMFSADVTAQFEDSGGAPTLNAHAVLMGRVSGIPQTGGTCQLQSLTLLVNNGILTATTSGGATAQATFQNTTVALSNIMYDASCVPQMYRLTFNGTAALQAPGGQPENVTLNQLAMDVDERGADTLLMISGGMTSTCLGGAATLSTPQALSVPRDEVCPNAGQIHVTSGGAMGNVFYRSDMSVDVDLDGDGVSEINAPNCLDPRLLMCAA